MLSSLGFDTKRRFFPEMPRGLSVHVFKHALAPSQQPAQPPLAPKYDAAQARVPSNGGGMWNRQNSSYQAARTVPEGERKPPVLPVTLSQDRRLVQVQQPGAPALASAPWASVERSFSKSQGSKGYAIHPSLDPESEMFIYERSILSVEDTLASSPSSDSSSDLDLFPDDVGAGALTRSLNRLEVSSTRASSSTETLESTLWAGSAGNANGGHGAVPGLASVSAQVPRPTSTPLAIAAPPPPPPPLVRLPALPARPASTRPLADGANAPRPVIPLERAESQRARTTSISHASRPVVQYSAGIDAASDSDSDTLFSFSDSPADNGNSNMVVDMLGASHWAMGAAAHASYAARSTTPFRRDSSDQPRPPRMRRESLDTGPAPLPPRASAPAPPPPPPPPPQTQYAAQREDGLHPRAPPGLYAGASVVATPPDPPRAPLPALAPAPASVASSPPAPAQNSSPGSAARAQQAHIPAAVSGSPPRTAPAPSASGRVPDAPVRTPSFAAAPSRRGSQSSSPHQPSAPVVPAPAKRTVRWTENLVCPSPVPPENRRKGWFNRRGDQLWTNEGQWKAPEPGQEYPPDLAHYPEPNTGWMNEEGVRIDMQHRLVPKRPLRSALKQPKNAA